MQRRRRVGAREAPRASARAATAGPIPREGLGAFGARLRRAGKRVVFTNGCFDLLHPGHVALLERARGLGDVLVVGLNGDRSVRGLKGPGRPVLPQRARARMILALKAVDYVTVFPEPTPLRTIRLLKPDVLVKGADWGADAIVGREEVESWGGRVVRVPLKRGWSTTRLIARIGKLAPRSSTR